MVPASDASLENQDFSGQNPVPLLLQVQVVGILQEDFGSAQLVVSLTQHCRADFGSCLPAVHLVGRGAAVDEVPVTLGELHEGVADRVACSPDPDRLHHPGVAQLAATQLTIEHLGGEDYY